MPDAPWITDYDSYFCRYYQCVPAEEFEEQEEVEPDD